MITSHACIYLQLRCKSKGARFHHSSKTGWLGTEQDNVTEISSRQERFTVQGSTICLMSNMLSSRLVVCHRM